MTSLRLSHYCSHTSDSSSTWYADAPDRSITVKKKYYVFNLEMKIWGVGSPCVFVFLFTAKIKVFKKHEQFFFVYSA